MKNLILGLILGAVLAVVAGAAATSRYQIAAVYCPDTKRVVLLRVDTATGAVSARQLISTYGTAPMTQIEPPAVP